MNSAGLVDLDEVAAYWKSRKLVDDNHLSFYTRWLSRFLIGPGANPRLSAADAQRLFIEGLERDGGVASWQIRQAAHAVDLYLKHYLRFRVATGADDSAGGACPPSANASHALSAASACRNKIGVVIPSPAARREPGP